MTSMPHLPEIKYDYADQLNEVKLDASNNKAYYIYDAEGNRVRKVIVKGNIVEERFYIGDYEIYTKKTNGALDIAVQQGKVNQGQLKVLQQIQKYGQGQGVNVNIHYIK